MPIRHWLLYADHGVAPICRSLTRQGYVEERTATINRIRGLLAEFGIVLPQRADEVRRAAIVLAERLPMLAREAIADLRAHLTHLDQRITHDERQLTA